MQAQIKARQQAQQLQDALQDLHTWEKSINAKDEALKRHKAGVPVTHAATHTYDHYRDKWDAFDVDAALASSDDDAPAQPPKPLLAPLHTRTLPPRLPTSALEWKDHGNTQFRNRRYAAAIESYTTSIDLEPTCIAYANRAMARLKLKKHADAERDASAALELDASYVKAWQRRAAARAALGRALEAAGDLERAVLLAPDNTALVADYRATVQALEASGALAPAPPLHLEVAAEDAAAEEGASEGHLPKQALEEGATSEGTAPKQALEEPPLQQPATAGVAQRAATAPAAQRVPAPVHRQAAAVVHNALGPRPRPPHPSAPPATRPTPKTGIEFETAWRALKGDAAAQAALLLATPPARLPALWKHSLSPDLLAGVLTVLGEHVVPQHREHALGMLRALRDVPRIGVVVRLVPASVVGGLRAALGHVDAEALSALRAST